MDNFYAQKPPSPASGRTITFLGVARLLNQLHDLGMLGPEFTFPEHWRDKREFSADELSNLVREHLSREGWQRLLEAFRYHNHQPEVLQWDLSNASDFLASLEFSLGSDEISVWEGRRKDLSKSMVRGIFGHEGITRLVHGLGQNIRSWLAKLSKPAPSSGRIAPLLAFIEWLRARMNRARAEAQADRALNQVASYVTRSLQNDMEREAVLQRVSRLRSQMQEQLETFCEEEGIPQPKPYSRDEAIYLHLISAYFVALAEAEKRLKRRSNQLAQRRIALEEQRVSAHTNGEVLPELLAVLQEIDPLREGLMRERIRHRIMVTIGGATTAIGSGLWGAVEAIFEVVIGGIARFAPVVAPAMLVGLATLVAQTVSLGIPLTLHDTVLFLEKALWNATIALGAALVAYGCWLYFTRRGKLTVEPSQISIPTQVDQDGSQSPAHTA
jgi:hypothetical protein